MGAHQLATCHHACNVVPCTLTKQLNSSRNKEAWSMRLTSSRQADDSSTGILAKYTASYTHRQTSVGFYLPIGRQKVLNPYYFLSWYRGGPVSTTDTPLTIRCRPHGLQHCITIHFITCTVGGTQCYSNQFYSLFF